MPLIYYSSGASQVQNPGYHIPSWFLVFASEMAEENAIESVYSILLLQCDPKHPK